MSISLVNVENADTFGVWKDRTNEIITALQSVATLGEFGDSNVGHLAIDGDINSTGTIKSNTIDVYDASILSIDSDIKVSGEIQLKSVVSGDSLIKLYKDGDLSWTIGSNSVHTEFIIKKGTAYLKIGDIDGTNGVVSGSGGLKLHVDLLPDNINANTSGNASTASAWQNGRTITLTGDVTGTSGTWTGSGNISFETTVANNSHSHTTANITGLSTALDAKLALSGGTMTGDLKINSDVNVQLGTTVGATTSIRRGEFGTVTDAFSITTTGANVDTYISLPGSTLYIANGTTLKASIDSSGNIVSVGDMTAFGSVSDINRKENVVRITNALDKIKQVSGYTYNYKGDPTPMTGVVAQEFEEILPEVVYNTVSIDGVVSKAVRHGNIVGLLIEAIKELELQIQELKSGK